MALPSSGPLTLAQIQGEFGGSNPISLSEYYAGGGLVAAGTSGTYGAVPSSGTISIQNFYGTSNVTYAIYWGNYSGSSAEQNYPELPFIALYNNATAFFYGQYGGETVTKWLTPFPAATSVTSQYECRFSVNSSTGFITYVGSPLNTWLNLGSNQFIAIEPAFTPGYTVTAQIQVEVRQVSQPGIYQSANFGMACIS
jgi:hypothetical protein